ncbi:hypothetical protein [Streptomyces sp. NBC_00568]|uniref:hypothetical protein n=1 Tax=Streptomyces sp. NBC_00568 TaxID=2975779 RepID=UPI002250386B|nr:hypothetical protein [Streptomyces sp. NBC_00568]MCX4993437.1 hypothetical protein [Streptomyces sp. NBC_00568]
MTFETPPPPAMPPMPGQTPGPMPVARRRRRNLVIAAITAGAVAIGGGVFWLTRPSYGDIVKDCQKALAAQFKADEKGKPSACNDVKKDDYDALVLNAAMGDLGWLDDDGHFDERKMQEDTLEDMQP